MRLEPIKPETLTSEQHAFYEQISKDVQKHLKGFVWKRKDGALLGPFNPMLHFPQFGKGLWAFTMGLEEHTTLPKKAHEVVILVVGARFGARYELYAHEQVADAAGLSAAKIATITAGERPSNLSDEEAVAYDVASALCRGGSLPTTIYEQAVKAFGEDGMAELAFLAGGYMQVSALLNAYDIPVPEADE